MVYGVLRVRLYGQTQGVNEEAHDINDWLMSVGFADKCEESHISQLDHKKREERALLAYGSAERSESVNLSEWVLRTENQQSNPSVSSFARRTGKRVCVSTCLLRV